MLKFPDKNLQIKDNNEIIEFQYKYIHNENTKFIRQKEKIKISCIIKENDKIFSFHF